MPKYDQLLLEFGGGVINAKYQSEAYKKAACVAIGIGGTGIAALKRLKKNVYQQLIPDDPEAPVPTYSHIKFIAVDADEIDPGQGKGKLSNSEMFSIKNPNLFRLVTERSRQTIENDTRMSWMDIENIIAMLNIPGSSRIRQVGRYLLISKAEELKLKIKLACSSAMQAANTNTVTVYVFSGISGETGGGCFIDTCYIIRRLMDENGWSASGKIIGLFFLPDVVNSKRDVAVSSSSIKRNNINGYAAMKELDYLMNLRQVEDRFYQNYGDFTIDTQEPPVDMCHLISATKEDGHLLPDGFYYCINAAADYVMSYLIDDTGMFDDGMNDRGISLRRLLAHVNYRTVALARIHGASRAYHIIGVSSAEIPLTQFFTYLAAGFMGRFSQLVGREKAVAQITKKRVNEWANKLNLTPHGILEKVNHGSVPLMLPDVDRSLLKALGQMPRGKVPEIWAKPGNDFLYGAEGRRRANCNSLKADIEDYSLDTMPTGQTSSIICIIFNMLYSISTDSELGPYYAAHLIHNTGYDLEKAINGVIEKYEVQKRTQEICLYGSGNGGGGIADNIVQVSSDFIRSHFFNERSAYNKYKQTVEDFVTTVNRIIELEDAISVMKTVRHQLNELYHNYYVPMIEMLDNVKESFDEDLDFLKLPRAQQATAYTWQILKLSEVQDSLDQLIKALQPKVLVTDFLNAVMSDYQEWINRDSDRITTFISKFMSEVFYQQMYTSFQDYLKMKYSNTATPQDFAKIIEREIIEPVFYRASSMFWCDSKFSLQNETYRTTLLSVPISASAVCTVAELFSGNVSQSCIIRKTGLNDRITAKRLYTGIPFYAYHGVNILKEDYDAWKNSISGAGLHLYAKTGRGSDGTGDKDWVNFLPDLIPYSMDGTMTSQTEAKINIYKEACELGIIGPETSSDNYWTGERWLLRVSKPVDEKQYTAEEFMTEDAVGRVMLDQVAIQSVRSHIEDRLEHGWDEENLKRKIDMRNDGAREYGAEVVAAVRMDYFISSPIQQEIAKEEIRKYHVLREQLMQLDAIVEEHLEAKRNLEEFCGMLFYNLFESENFVGRKSFTKIARMFYPYKEAGIYTELELSSLGKDFRHGEQYPLYQAFLTYISLDRDKMPRKEMLAKYNARKAGPLQKSDSIIARTLELQWDNKAIIKLHMQASELSEGKEIVGFYTGLVLHIREFRDKFDYEDWIETGTDRNSSAIEKGVVMPAMQSQIVPVYVSDGNEIMLVYPEMSRERAWNAARDQWVLLTSNMWIYLNNNWEPIELDQHGKIII